MKRLAVLISGGGSNLQSIIDAARAKKINGNVVLVISSNADAFGIQCAQKEGIDTEVCALSSFASRQDRDAKILQLLDSYNIDLVVLAGYLGILSSNIVERYYKRIINIHPALLPKFGGQNFHGLNVHREVLNAGEKVSGATVHYVDKGIDTGEIIARREVKVEPTFTAEDLQKKVLEVEHQLIVDVLTELCK